MNRAMLIEDTEELRALMLVYLQQLGFTVAVYSAGTEALVAVDNGYTPAVVITDLDLGSDVRGDDLILTLRKVLKDCIFLLWTSHVLGTDIATSVSAIFLPKDANRNQIWSVLQEAGYDHHP